jgi:hypothetical protein
LHHGCVDPKLVRAGRKFGFQKCAILSEGTTNRLSAQKNCQILEKLKILVNTSGKKGSPKQKQNLKSKMSKKKQKRSNCHKEDWSVVTIVDNNKHQIFTVPTMKLTSSYSQSVFGLAQQKARSWKWCGRLSAKLHGVRNGDETLELLPCCMTSHYPRSPLVRM